MKKINQIAKKYKLFVIEDAHATQRYLLKNKFAGNFGDIGVL